MRSRCGLVAYSTLRAASRTSAGAHHDRLPQPTTRGAAHVPGAPRHAVGRAQPRAGARARTAHGQPGGDDRQTTRAHTPAPTPAQRRTRPQGPTPNLRAWRAGVVIARVAPGLPSLVPRLPAVPVTVLHGHRPRPAPARGHTCTAPVRHLHRGTPAPRHTCTVATCTHLHRRHLHPPAPSRHKKGQKLRGPFCGWRRRGCRVRGVVRVVAAVSCGRCRVPGVVTAGRCREPRVVQAGRCRAGGVGPDADVDE
jgi:hypothetical protein